MAEVQWGSFWDVSQISNHSLPTHVVNMKLPVVTCRLAEQMLLSFRSLFLLSPLFLSAGKVCPAGKLGNFCCAWRHCTCTGIEEIAWPRNDTESIWRWRHKRAPCRCQGIKQRRRHIKVQIQTQHQATMHGRCLQGSLFRPRTADCSVEARTGRSQGVFLRFFNFLGCFFILCCQYM